MNALLWIAGGVIVFGIAVWALRALWAVGGATTRRDVERHRLGTPDAVNPSYAGVDGDTAGASTADGRPKAPETSPPVPTALAGVAGREQRVDAGALAPAAVQRGVPFRVDVVLAPAAAIAERLAMIARRRGLPPEAPTAHTPLAEPLRDGERVELVIECLAATSLAPRVQRVRWRGEPLTLVFQVLPADDARGERLALDINVFVQGCCIGSLGFDLPWGDDAAAPQRCNLQRPRRVFMSYTGHDRAWAVEAARHLRENGIETFMDRLSLEGGEDWEVRTFGEIDACDSFTLLWSQAASQSKWVVREAEYALALQQRSSQRRPRIVAHVIGPPPPAKPPPGLERLQFNDPLYVLWELEAARS